MAFRYPTSRCRSLPELEDRVRELVRQLEPVVLENRIVETTETAIAHGLGEVPGWVGWDPPHCVSIVRQTRAPDHRNIYLRAVKRCVINVRVLRVSPLLPGQMPNGGFTLPDWDPGGADNDHLVKAKNDDATTVGGLHEKTIDSPTVTRTVVTSGGVERVQFTANASAPGTQPDPTETSSYLYPARIDDPLDMGSVHCVFGLETCGYDTFADEWTQSGDTFTHTPLGGLPDTWFDGINPYEWDDDGYSTLVGKLVITPPTSELVAADKVDAGVFEILDTGMHYDNYGTASATLVYTHAKLRRVDTLNASADFVQGMTYYVEYGDNYAGNYATLQNASVVLDTTEQEWTFSTSAPSWSQSFELLSAAELVTRGASTATLDLGVTAAVGDGTVVMEGDDGETLFHMVSVPPAALPPGKVTFYLEGVLISGDKGDGVSNKITAHLYDDDGVGGLTEVVSATSQHIDWSTNGHQTARDITFQGQCTYSWPPGALDAGHTLSARYEFATDSTTDVAITFSYNSATRGTKVKVPWENSVFSGTNIHGELSGRDESDQHPLSAVNHHIVYATDDWTDGSWGNVPGLSVDVEGEDADGLEHTYLVEAVCYVQLGGEGCKMNIAGSAISTWAQIEHSFSELLLDPAYGQLPSTPVVSGTSQGILMYQRGTGGAVTVTASSVGCTTSDTIVWRMRGLVRVATGGTITVAADCEPIDYHASYVLEKSWLEVKRFL
jgi:hypothetical protein